MTQNKYGAILADPPWSFRNWSGKDVIPARNSSSTKIPASAHYDTMSFEEIAALPVADMAAEDCALFCWVVWPSLPDALRVIETWGFAYKTCGFCWVKTVRDLPLLPDDRIAKMGLGYWTRANSEVCLIATRGKPKRLNADVRQVIHAPLREHSRKPDETYDRIERLVDGPYLEMFSRQSRDGWDAWGNETGKFDAT